MNQKIVEKNVETETKEDLIKRVASDQIQEEQQIDDIVDEIAKQMKVKQIPDSSDKSNAEANIKQKIKT